MLIPFIKNQTGITTSGNIDEVIPFDFYIKNITSNITQVNEFPTLIESETTLIIPSLDETVLTSQSQQELTEDIFCSAPNFIEQQIPFWIKQNYTNSEETYLVPFLKSYYNWLYCGFKKNTTQLTPYDIDSLFDIDQVPDEFLDYYIQTYAPFIEVNSPLLQRQNLRKFIKNIKTNFLTTKGTKASVAYFLDVLFGITLERISFTRPILARLNGGRLENTKNTGNYFSIDLFLPSFSPMDQDTSSIVYWDDTGEFSGFTFFNEPGLEPRFTSGTINDASAYLQDNDFFQDYSYFLQTSASVEQAKYYANSFLKSVHPAGFKVFFEEYVRFEPYDFGSFDDNTDSVIPSTTSYELPVIQNYLLYYPNYNLNSAGITFCDCCNSDCDPTANETYFPIHTDPRWSTTIPNDITFFKDITIGSFIGLFPAETSPNPGINDCTACT